MDLSEKGQASPEYHRLYRILWDAIPDGAPAEPMLNAALMVLVNAIARMAMTKADAQSLAQQAGEHMKTHVDKAWDHYAQQSADEGAGRMLS